MGGIEQTLEARGKAYGNRHTQATIEMRMKDMFRSSDNWEKFSRGEQSSLDMIATKISRLLCGDPGASRRDSWHDIEGYAKLVADEIDRAIHCGEAIKATQKPLWAQSNVFNRKEKITDD